ncbi:MAG: IS200/IS605 family transposase [Agriterribacter sp.]
MSKYKKQSHVVYKCDYHIVWTPKYRFRILTGEVGLQMQRDIRMYSEWLGCEIIELNVQLDHVHVVVSIPPKVSISTYMGTVKGNTAIRIFKNYPMSKKRPYWGNHFWSRGYFVNTVGINEDMIRRYVKYQEEEERKEEGNQQGFDFDLGT